MISQSQVAPIAGQSSLAAGTTPPLRSGQLGDLIVSELHGRYYETAYRRNLFSAANQAATTTTVGLATAYTGIALSNPIGSTVNLVVDKVGYSAIVAFPAGAAIGLMVGYNGGTNVTHTTPGTPRSAFYGVGAAGQGLVDVSCTFPTAPVLWTLFGSGLTGAITTESQVSPTLVDLEGGLILPPGAYCAIYTSTVSGTSGFFGSIQWEEIPV